MRCFGWRGRPGCRGWWGERGAAGELRKAMLGAGVGGIKVVRDFFSLRRGDGIYGQIVLWSIGKGTDSYHQVQLLDRV
jgi:hypothetical protein